MIPASTSAHSSRAIAIGGPASTSGTVTGATDGITIPVPVPTVPDDFVRITHVGQDFGDGSLIARAPSDYGTLTWDLAGRTITPRLKGKLFMSASFGVRARMMLNYYDIHDNYLDTTLGQSKTPEGNGAEEFPINLGSYSNPLIYRVDISIQVELGDTWTTVATEVATIGSSNHSVDAVVIRASGVDFGGLSFFNGAPAGNGYLVWDLGNGTITPRLDGSLYGNRSQGVTARVRMRHFDVRGALLASPPPGANHLFTSNDLEVIPVSLGTYSNQLIYRTEVSIEVRSAGVWSTFGPVVTVTI